MPRAHREPVAEPRVFSVSPSVTSVTPQSQGFHLPLVLELLATLRLVDVPAAIGIVVCVP